MCVIHWAESKYLKWRGRLKIQEMVQALSLTGHSPASHSMVPGFRALLQPSTLALATQAQRGSSEGSSQRVLPSRGRPGLDFQLLASATVGLGESTGKWELTFSICVYNSLSPFPHLSLLALSQKGVKKSTEEDRGARPQTNRGELARVGTTPPLPLEHEGG